MSTSNPPCAPSAASTPRNLIVCCDGTGQMWGCIRDTNVVKLVRACSKDAEQLVYYDPGVGSPDWFPAVNRLEETWYRLRQVFGLALGRGVYENVAQAYSFLVTHYRRGDRIFLFGFSRGAFTVRSVSGLVSLFGLVRPSASALMPMLLRIYYGPQNAERERLARDLRCHFTDELGAHASIHFVGVWDTVESVGGVGGLIARRMPENRGIQGLPIAHVRHAVSEGEYRRVYAPRLYDTLPSSDDDDAPAQSVVQRWFPGAHADVGGGYAECGLSNVALSWLTDEAVGFGLRLSPTHALGASLSDHARTEPVQPTTLCHDQALAMPLWALTGLRRRSLPPRDLWHPSLVQAMDAPRDTRAPSAPAFWRNPWLLGSLLLTLGSAVGEQYASRVPNDPHSSAREVAWLQLTAPASPEALPARYGAVLRDALRWDCGFIAAYTVLLCVLNVYAVRALRMLRPSSAALHETLQWAFLVPLWTLPLSDLLENLFTELLLGGQALYAWPLAAASAIKWTSLLVLLLLYLFAIVAPRLHGRLPARWSTARVS